MSLSSLVLEGLVRTWGFVVKVLSVVGWLILLLLLWRMVAARRSKLVIEVLVLVSVLVLVLGLGLGE